MVIVFSNRLVVISNGFDPPEREPDQRRRGNIVDPHVYYTREDLFVPACK
jgi:hypothetical protein